MRARLPDMSAPRRRYVRLLVPAVAGLAVVGVVLAVAVLRPTPVAPPPTLPLASTGTDVDAYLPPLQDAYTITDLSGPRWGRVHWGLDLACPTGTPFYAVHGGTVTYAGYEHTYGLWLKLEYGDVTMVYAHASALAAAHGAVVEAGDLLGYVGATGHAAGPHLHFEVRVHDGIYDALQFLREHGVVLTPASR